MTRTIIPAIMSGGAGSRLWPLSTEARPKQFHALASERTMIQETALRLTGQTGDIAFAPPIVIGNASQVDLITDQLRAVGIEPALVVLEPQGRNTAATACLAALTAQEIDPRALVLLAPADHVIGSPDAFHAAIARAARVADERIVTFGIVPDRPETGYGYIQSGTRLADGVLSIASFKEKPNQDVARAYLAEGGYYWNAGIFLFSPGVMLEEFRSVPEIRETASACLARASRSGALVRLGPDFGAVPEAPVDIAVMEKTRLGAVVPCDIDWADIGSFAELWRFKADGPQGVVAQGQVVANECEGTLILAEGVTVAAAGLQDLVIVATPEAVLILPKHRAQEVRELRKAALAAREGPRSA